MNEFDDDLELDEEDVEVSKSELKRQSTAKEALGVRLCDLSKDQLNKLDLSNTLAQAVREFQRIRHKGSKAYGALKRQKQYLGKVMRNIDDRELDKIEQFFTALDNHSQIELQKFHNMEVWRDRLLEDGDKGIDVLYAEIEDLDFSHRQNLRQIIRQHQKELKKQPKVGEDGKPLRAPKTSRQMFKYLRDEVFSS